MVDEAVFPGDPVSFAGAPDNMDGPGVGVGASGGSANGDVSFSSSDKGPVAPQGPQVKEEMEVEEEKGEQESPGVQQAQPGIHERGGWVSGSRREGGEEGQSLLTLDPCRLLCRTTHRTCRGQTERQKSV